MIAFLTGVAAVTALALFFSGLTRVNGSRPLDKTSAGPWGLLQRVSEPRRTLSAEERRWQTTLQRSETDQGIWRDLVKRLNELERTLGGDPPTSTAPDFDRGVLRATITRLETLGKRESGDS